MELSGKVAVITGASRGLGRVLALDFARRGARLAMIGRTPETLASAAREVEAAGAEVLPLQGDVTLVEDVDRLVAATFKHWGQIDLLVNNVGYYFSKPLHETSPQEWDTVMSVKSRAAFLCTRRVLPGMLARGSGAIVSITSGGGHDGTANFSAFCASEHAVLGMMKALAEELRGTGVKAAVVLPRGTIEHERTRGFGGRPETWINPEDIAAAVVFLANQSPRAMTLEIVVEPPKPLYG
ncbi:MAG: SDR family oxidoreductase [Candidatus Tectomicrobia bacterium]|nr:SDR family oxidoreductase [Candidatus Tectomicrobia bacterium]